MRVSKLKMSAGALMFALATTGAFAQSSEVVAEAPESFEFGALNGVEAVPMATSEMDAVRGLHFHFTTPSGKDLLVNVQKGKLINGGEFVPTPNFEPSDTFPFIVGRGYRGLCGAALKAVGLSIPGQDTNTGIGGGC